MAATPRELGYRMPAEWERHESTWLAWPHDPLTWPGRVPVVEDRFVEMIRALAPHERVDLLVKDARLEAKVAARLRDEKIENVRLHRVATADSWIRDYGPAFLTRGQTSNERLAYNRWIFNAWGGKYETLLPDDGIPERLPAIQHLPRFTPGIVLEGGSIEVDGRGTVLTTEQCLLHPNRNPTLSPAQIEATLREFLGADRILWLRRGIEGDDTDGHIDDIARFANEHTILAASEPDTRDANHGPLEENLNILRSFRDTKGRPYRIVELPMPGRVGGEDGRLPASYANFYVANNVVLLPAFGHPNDGKAEAILAREFPGRRVVPVRCEDVVWGMGTLHCLTQQQPTTP